ncbi:unnamed protein product [Anisakis simplex]|uniref:Uncharacterized protein n=1 Tax=Anisakis simplex TaxID=6269 RepID=A0A0M3KJ08_ANISI|nr:unnamed protein product [Anisakis simplex]
MPSSSNAESKQSELSVQQNASSVVNNVTNSSGQQISSPSKFTSTISTSSTTTPIFTSKVDNVPCNPPQSPQISTPSTSFSSTSFSLSTALPQPSSHANQPTISPSVLQNSSISPLKTADTNSIAVDVTTSRREVTNDNDIPSVVSSSLAVPSVLKCEEQPVTNVSSINAKNDKLPYATADTDKVEWNEQKASNVPCPLAAQKQRQQQKHHQSSSVSHIPTFASKRTIASRDKVPTQDSNTSEVKRSAGIPSSHASSSAIQMASESEDTAMKDDHDDASAAHQHRSSRLPVRSGNATVSTSALTKHHNSSDEVTGFISFFSLQFHNTAVLEVRP